MKRTTLICLALSGLLATAGARDIHVDGAAPAGNGSPDAPFNAIQPALDIAGAGDVIHIAPGTYAMSGSLQTVRDGTKANPITVRAADAGNRPIITSPLSELTIDNSNMVFENLILDGDFDNSDVVRIRSGGDNAVLRNCEIRNGTKDGIDMNEADDVLIESCEIHHMLGGSYSNQVDAHGIVATGQLNLTIRNCDIYYVSGDCFQTDPGRGYPLWDNVLIEGGRFWTGPLPGDAADWNAGEIPGENGVDTKINGDAVGNGYRPVIVIRDLEAFGWEPGYINNRAALNIKENVECLIERVKVYDSEIAFRLRGPGSRGGARVTIKNAIAYGNEKTFRTEDGIENLKIYNSTFARPSGGDWFQNAGGGYDGATFDMRNCLFVGDKPSDADHASNLTASLAFFLDGAAFDFHLIAGSPAIDAGVTIASVDQDYDRNPRPAGLGFDVGAFEFGLTTGLETPVAAEGFALDANYPNPFNPETVLPFRLERASRVTLTVYNLLGQPVRRLVDAPMSPGEYRITWNGVDDQGRPMASGVYLYRLQVDGRVATRSMHLVR